MADMGGDAGFGIVWRADWTAERRPGIYYEPAAVPGYFMYLHDY